MNPNSAHPFRTDSGELIVHAHVSRVTGRGSSKRNKPTTESYFDKLGKQMTSKVAPQSYLKESNTDVSPAGKPFVPSPLPAADENVYWRIGTRGEVSAEEGTIPFQVWTIAKVPKATRGLNRRIIFGTAQTWTMHQGQVGFCDRHDELDFNSLRGADELDPAFKKFRGNTKAISEYLLDITDRINNNYKLVESFSQVPGFTTEIHFGPLVPSFSSNDQPLSMNSPIHGSLGMA